jgi:hypothetical protein
MEVEIMRNISAAECKHVCGGAGEPKIFKFKDADGKTGEPLVCVIAAKVFEGVFSALQKFGEGLKNLFNRPSGAK